MFENDRHGAVSELRQECHQDAVAADEKTGDAVIDAHRLILVHCGLEGLVRRRFRSRDVQQARFQRGEFGRRPERGQDYVGIEVTKETTYPLNRLGGARPNPGRLTVDWRDGAGIADLAGGNGLGIIGRVLVRIVQPRGIVLGLRNRPRLCDCRFVRRNLGDSRDRPIRVR